MSFGGQVPGKGNGGRLASSRRGNAVAPGAGRPSAPGAAIAEIESPSSAAPVSDPGDEFIGVDRGSPKPPDCTPGD